MFCVTNSICTLSLVSALPTLMTTVVTDDKDVCVSVFLGTGGMF